MYFLLFCSEEEAKKFLGQYSSFPPEPGDFYKKAYPVFLKTKNLKKTQENPRLRPWYRFGLKNSYEEVLAVILLEVLRCPLPEICWTFPLPPEVWEFRRQKGIKALFRELEESSQALKTRDQKLNLTVRYCQDLKAHPLPRGLTDPAGRLRFLPFCSWKTLILGGLGLLVLAGGLTGWTLFFGSQPVILYQVPF